MFNNFSHVGATTLMHKLFKECKKPDRRTFCGVQVSHTSLNIHSLSVEVSINSWKVFERFVTSIYLNTSSRIEVFS